MRSEGQPHDPLTAVGAAMLETFEAQTTDKPNARAIVIISHGDHDRGIALAGYDSDDGPAQAVDDLIGHAHAILKTMGMRLEVIRVPRGSGGRA
jgi:hypothetical protein